MRAFRHRVSVVAVTLVALGSLGPAASADEPPDGPAARGESDAPAPSADAEEPEAEPTAEERAAAMSAIKVELGAIDGPKSGVEVGDVATIDVPEGHWFVPKAGMAKFNKLIENLDDPTAIGALTTSGLDSVVYFSFNPTGYVKDDDQDLDADELLASMREGAAQENAERRRLGYAEMEVVGWAKEPFYNAATKSLEWAPRYRHPGQAEEWVNYNTRRLGREGVIEVVLATSVERIDAEVATMNRNLSGLAFVPGKDYASFRQGDRIAEYGLGGLVVGGAVAVAAKMGFLKKFWKLLVGGIVVLGAGIAKLFGRKPKGQAVVASEDA